MLKQISHRIGSLFPSHKYTEQEKTRVSAEDRNIPFPSDSGEERSVGEDGYDPLQNKEDIFDQISLFAKIGYARFNLLSRKGYASSSWYHNIGEQDGIPLSVIIRVHAHFHPEDRTKILQFFDEVEAGKNRHFQGDIRIIHDDGTLRWLRLNVMVKHYLPEQGIIDVLCLNYDITDETEARLQLADYKAKTELIIDTCDIAQSDYHIDTHTIHTYRAGALCPGSDLNKEQYFAYVHPDDREKCRVHFDKMDARQQGTTTLMYRMKLPVRDEYSDVVVSVTPLKDRQGRILSYTGLRRDLTQINKVNEKLREINQLNNLILSNIDSGLAYITLDYHVKWTNVEKMNNLKDHPLFKGYRQGEVCYKSVRGLDAPCEHCILRDVIAKQEAKTTHIQYEGMTIEATGVPVFDDGKLQGVLFKIDDITERERVHHELEQARLKAEQSDRLKSVFLANMSHEIRTPLNAIVGFSELLQMTDNPDERTAYMNIVNQNSELLLRLIGDILDLSKLESGTVEHNIVRFDIAEFFEETGVVMRYRLTNPEVEFVVSNPYQHCFVHGDKGRLSQLLTNYVTNAIKYTPKGYIKMGYEYANGGLKVYVEDTGIGIAEDKKSRIFQRFEKLDEFAQGTGLGLSICKAIAEACDGCVGFESTEGKGSTFWAFWPLEAEIVPREQPQQQVVLLPSMTPQTGSSREPYKEKSEGSAILVAEDDDSNYLLVKAILKKDRLTRAVNGQEAVDLASSEHFDVILMDLKMPVMGGLEATAKIRTFDSSTPIIALTANAFEYDRANALAAGCSAYLTKPLRRQELQEMLASVCKSR